VLFITGHLCLAAANTKFDQMAKDVLEEVRK